MSGTTFGLLATIGVAAFALVDAIRRVERRLAESEANQYRLAARVAELEKEVRHMRR